jgi:8-oxo-dGTP pyrophosphatase MutT (NUDIX family)
VGRPHAADERLAECRGLLSQRRRTGPVDEREAASIDAFEEALERLSSPFDEHADPTHVTSSAIVVSEDGDAVCLLRHKRLGIWLQPGGHLEPGEALVTGAVREAAEETGLALRQPVAGPALVHVDVHAGGRGHTHLDLRWLLVGSGPLAPGAGESPDVGWFSWEGALAIADPGLAGALRALRPRRTQERTEERT